MTAGWCRERATTRVAPTTGLPEPIFRGMTEVAYGELRGHAAMPCVWDCCTIRRVANEGAYDLTFDAAIVEKGAKSHCHRGQHGLCAAADSIGGHLGGRQVLRAEGGLRRRCGLVLGGEARQGSRGGDRRQRAPRNTRQLGDASGAILRRLAFLHRTVIG